MSRATKEINRITGAIIGISGRLIVCALVVLLLYEGVTKGYEFGHSIFFSPGMEAAPGTDKTFRLTGEESVREVGRLLEEAGLIRDRNAFSIQAFCYEYEVQAGEFKLNTSMTSKEIISALEETSGEGTEAG